MRVSKIAVLAAIYGVGLCAFLGFLIVFVILPFITSHEVQSFNDGLWVIQYEPSTALLGSRHHLYRKGTAESVLPGISGWFQDGDWVYFRSQYGIFATLQLSTDSLTIYEDPAMAPAEQEKQLRKLIKM
jgi:hypothetical protein